MAKILFRTKTGRIGTLVGGAMLAVALWVGLGGSMRAAAPVADPVTCLPTCAVNDGRFLVVAGNDPTTLASQEIIIGLRFTQGSGDANFDIFDGDPNSSNWDVPWADGNPSVPDPNAPKLVIEVYNDPGGVGGLGLPLATFTPGGVPGTIEKGDWEIYFPSNNNNWAGLSFPQQPDALNSAGGYYQYAFHFRAYNPNVDRGWNAFKFRAAGTVLVLGKQVVGFLGGMNIPNDVATIYPNFSNNQDLSGSTYDGSWTFNANLPSFLQQVTLFDGDMDFGDDTCTYRDTDDPDSTGVPVFAQGTAAVDEGVALATGVPASAACDGVNLANGVRSGLPSDDNSSPVWRRAPGIVPSGVAYQVQAPASPGYPSGQIFLNQNPSGNREWEQFRIQKVAPGDFPLGTCPVGGYPEDVGKGYAASDCRTDELPGGAWEVQLRGMDLSNLNFFFFDFDFAPPSPNVYSIGRLVWYDDNKNGVQDLCAGVPCAPELGIANVAYSVYDGPLPGGTLVRAGVTDADGEFVETSLPAGNYTVIVDDGNFDPGQPLKGFKSTTGGEVENGVEVGLPICTDVGVPAGCGHPGYAEAIFGYVHPSVIECLVNPVNGGTSFVGATHEFIANPPGAPTGAITIRTTLNAPRFVDNTYGTNAIGWPNGHKFGDLVGSDHLQLSLFNVSGVVKLQFKLDYITASSGAPGGYKTLGVTGGEGQMIVGSASNIWDVDTSLSNNFENGMALTVNSPATDASYTPNLTYPNWIYQVWYDVTFKTDLFGGPDGFAAVRVAGVHASPSKTGSNTETCIYEGDPGLAVVDSYSTKKNVTLNVVAPGVLANDTDPFDLPLTAVLVTPPASNRGTLTLNADGSFSLVPYNNYTGDVTFSYKTFNGTSYSNTIQNKVKVTK